MGGSLGERTDSNERTDALRTLRITDRAGSLTALWSSEDEPLSTIKPAGVLRNALSRL